MPSSAILLTVLALAGAWLCLRRVAPGMRLVFAALAFVAIAWQLIRFPHGWQILPALIALVVTTALVLRPQRPASRMERRWARPLVAFAALVGCLATVFLFWALPVFQLPQPTGQYAVGTRTMHWTDGSRNRELVTQVWYPAVAGGPRAHYRRASEVKKRFLYQADMYTNGFQDAPIAQTPGPLPVLIFSHMWGGRRGQDEFVAEDLASHGYFVISLDHPGNAAKVEMADGHVVHSTMFDALSNIDQSTPEAIHTLWNTELAVWTADNEFALNQLAAANTQPGGWVGGRLNMNLIGAFGHSFGGSASIRLLGLDPRVHSAINIDGWAFGGLADRNAGQQAMFLYEARDEGMAGGTPTGNSVDDVLERDDQMHVRASLAQFGGYRGYVTETQHADFTDATLLSPLQRLTWTGPIAGPRVRMITRALILGFFDQTLLGKGAVPSFPEVKMTRSEQAQATR